MSLSRDEVLKILLVAQDDPGAEEWTLQGFGMLRCYRGDETRLQIWDQRLAVWANNTIHDHPWNFTSTIIAGTIWNQRFVRDHRQTLGYQDDRHYDRYQEVRIRPGSEGEALGPPSEIRLAALPLEMYSMGETYSQIWSELHITRYANGTVTVIDRERVGDKDVASSIRPIGGEWTFYRPRPATHQEIHIAVESALKNWWGPRDFL